MMWSCIKDDLFVRDCVLKSPILNLNEVVNLCRGRSTVEFTPRFLSCLMWKDLAMFPIQSSFACKDLTVFPVLLTSSCTALMMRHTCNSVPDGWNGWSRAFMLMVNKLTMGISVDIRQLHRRPSFLITATHVGMVQLLRVSSCGKEYLSFTPIAKKACSSSAKQQQKIQVFTHWQRKMTNNQLMLEGIRVGE